MYTTKGMADTYSTQDRSRMLYSQAPTMRYNGGDTNYQSIESVRQYNSYQGNTDRNPSSNAYISQHRGQVQQQRNHQDVQEQWRQYYKAIQNQQYGTSSAYLQNASNLYASHNSHHQPTHLANSYNHQQNPSYYQQYQPAVQGQRQVYQNYGQRQYRRQFIPVRPIMPNQVKRVAQSQYNLPSIGQGLSSLQNDFKVFCPACHQQYYNSQVQQHIQRHYLYNTDQFKLNSLDLDITNDSINPISLQPKAYYPLIQPLEFETKQLDEVNYLNRYKMSARDINRKNNRIKVRSASTQFAPPPLQLKSNTTDLYNCFDNLFNSKNKFSVKDLTKSNKILAKKRHLDDWEAIRSQKEDYTPKRIKQSKRRNGIECTD